MKRLMTLMMVMAVMAVMVLSVGTVEARHPTMQYPQGYSGYSGGRYGGGYGDSDAGKMLAAGQLIEAISRAVSSWESTHRTLDMGERAQRDEYENRRNARSARTIYGVPIAQTEPQKIVVVIERSKEYSQKESESSLLDPGNQKLLDKIEKLKQEKKVLEKRQELQETLDALEKDVQRIKSSANPD